MAHIFCKSFPALALFVTFAAVVPAQAQDCSTLCSRYVEGQCVEYTQTCTRESAPAPSFGAIAYGRKSKAFGYSFQWNSQAKAESTALQNCAKSGSDCEIMVWFDRKCGAVSARADSTAAYWGIGENIGQARTTAMGQCTKDGGKQCEVKASQCSK